MIWDRCCPSRICSPRRGSRAHGTHKRPASAPKQTHENAARPPTNSPHQRPERMTENTYPEITCLPITDMQHEPEQRLGVRTFDSGDKKRVLSAPPGVQLQVARREHPRRPADFNRLAPPLEVDVQPGVGGNLKHVRACVGSSWPSPFLCNPPQNSETVPICPSFQFPGEARCRKGAQPRSPKCVLTRLGAIKLQKHKIKCDPQPKDSQLFRGAPGAAPKAPPGVPTHRKTLKCSGQSQSLCFAVFLTPMETI